MATLLALHGQDGLDFHRVIAFDKSPAQLAQAKPCNNIDYMEGDVYQMPVSTHSADLVTIGQAAHWFNIPRLLTEVVRVLRPGGTLAILGYGICSLEHSKADDAFKEFYSSLGSHLPLGHRDNYWDCDRHLLDTGLAKVRFSPPMMQKDHTRIWLNDTRIVSQTHFFEYLKTMSAYQTYSKKHPDKPDLVEALMKNVQKTIGSSSDIKVTFPFFMILARAPNEAMVPMEDAASSKNIAGVQQKLSRIEPSGNEMAPHGSETKNKSNTAEKKINERKEDGDEVRTKKAKRTKKVEKDLDEGEEGKEKEGDEVRTKKTKRTKKVVKDLVRGGD